MRVRIEREIEEIIQGKNRNVFLLSTNTRWKTQNKV